MSSVALLTGDEIMGLVSQATQPIVERLEKIEKKQLQAKLLYSTEEVAAIVSVKPRTVRHWVQQGKADRNGKTHYLHAVELVRGRYVLELEKVMQFVHHFR